MIGSISGNVGGVNFANSSGSKVVRKARRPNKVNTEQQIKQQTRIAQISGEWRALDDLTRQAWKTYAFARPRQNRLGVARALSGYQSFMQYTLFTEEAGGAIGDLPPTNFTPQEMFNYSLESSVSGGIILNFETPSPLVSKQWYIYGRPLFRETIPAFNNTWSFLGIAIETGLEHILDPEWQTRYPLPILNQVIAIRVVPVTIADFVPTSIVDLFAKTAA